MVSLVERHTVEHRGDAPWDLALKLRTGCVEVAKTST